MNEGVAVLNKYPVSTLNKTHRLYSTTEFNTIEYYFVVVPKTVYTISIVFGCTYHRSFSECRLQ